MLKELPSLIIQFLIICSLDIPLQHRMISKGVFLGVNYNFSIDPYLNF
jgi:hypothetical protein